MFQNRFGALFFVGITVLGAAALVGTEENGGTISDAKAKIEEQRTEFLDEADKVSSSSASVGSTAPGSNMQVEIEFTPDADLVQDPAGINPAPIMPDPFAAEIVSVEPAQNQQGSDLPSR
ncbi:hypothetical protein [Parerythrobacter jejuensis]|uniref:Uncharacterized protein n=1 Tax=Parerythrobacter jejuensis TaxID=795812 RepID=A0A845AM83_9SPHN|nr:hypothetical protein [Parerythrobacter jejuensis]MXP30724.1 hypothetical protein [Parerythrobacter jejuensis]MXP33484.1 hypothetical protein [Parerythrobacter jejuensis]